MNQFLTHFLGYSTDEFLNLSYWDLTPEKYQAQELLQLAALRHTDRYGPYDKEYRNASGELIPIRLNGVRVNLQGESYIWSIVEPIVSTTQPHVNQHHRAYGMHSDKMEALNQVVAGLAHEINNPINFIHGNLKPLDYYTRDLLDFASHCQAQAAHLPADLRDRLANLDLAYLQDDIPNILESCHKGSSRIRDIILALHRFSLLNQEGVKKLNLHESLDDCLVFLQHRITRLNVHLIHQYATIPEIEGFGAELNQALFNLLSNAIDAVESVKNPEITITTEVYGKHVAVRIRDNGIGISPDDSVHILNPFFTTKPVGSGTGLGLTIAHQIITEQHHGLLSFDSELGQGSEFMIQLPCCQDQS